MVEGMNLVQVSQSFSINNVRVSQLIHFHFLQAKKFVETLPAVLRADIPKDEAEKLKDAVAAAGGVCEIV